jgi:hypothetical protein
MHQGVTPGSHPIDFNTFAGSLFQEQIIPKFIEFLKIAYRKFLSFIFTFSKYYLFFFKPGKNVRRSTASPKLTR